MTSHYHTSGKPPHWSDFIRDFGDAFGGFLVGYGVALSAISPIIIGSAFILLSIYIRFYSRH